MKIKREKFTDKKFGSMLVCKYLNRACGLYSPWRPYAKNLPVS